MPRLRLALIIALSLSFGAGRPPVPLPPGISGFEDPGGAQAYYAAKRQAKDGRMVDLYQRYQAARRHLARMPQVSSPDRLRLPRSSAGKQDLVTARWEALGPGNIGGRTRALLIHPLNPQILYSGGVSGGIWKSEDGGDRWRPLNDFLPNLAVSAMAMHPTNPDVIYTGTGEGHFREVVRGTGLPLRGAGIFRSEDAGRSWARLAGATSEDFYWVNDLIVVPAQPDRLYAATRTGIWRSSDGGETWSRVLAPANFGGCFDLARRTDRDTDYLLASCGTFAQAAVYLNPAAESAQPWVESLADPGMGRTSLAFAPSNQNVVYALAASYVAGPGDNFRGGLHAVFQSREGGAPDSWEARVRNTDAVKLNTVLLTNPLLAHLEECGSAASGFYSNLGWYTNVIAVDPTDSEIVWAGGVDLFRSDDGGANWGPVTYWAASPPSAHADQHVIRFHPDYDGESNQTMFLAGDGGVWRSDNARADRPIGPQAVCDPANSSVEWTGLNHNLGITQFYHGVPFPDGRRYLGGTQDNGTLLGSDAGGSDAWDMIHGGDGGYVAVDPADPETLYAESQRLGFVKSVDGGRTFRQSVFGITEPASNFLFIAPFQMDPSDPKRLWIGGRRLWRTSDAARTWTAASAAPPSSAGKISAIAVAPSNPKRVVAGTDDGLVYRQSAALSADGATPWPASRPRSGFVSWLAFDPRDSDIVYATYAGFGGDHVWKSADGGINWVSLDGRGDTSLPDIPVHAVLVNPEDGQSLFLATDLGVLVSHDGGLNWGVEITGFPNTVTESISRLERGQGESALFAFTHGRGAWRAILGVQGTPPCIPERWLPHVTPPDAPFTTTILATNFSGGPVRAELVPYLEDGSASAPLSLEVPAGASLARLSTELFGQENISHIGICGDSSLAFSAAHRIASIQGASAHSNETSTVDTEFLFYPGEWEIVFDGMALINVGDAPAGVTAVLLDRDNQEVARAILNDALAPSAKQLAVFDAEFPGRRGQAVRLESTQPAVVLMLRGTRPPNEPMLLYQVVPLAVTARK